MIDAAAWYAGSRSLLTRVKHGSAWQQPCREALKVSGGTATYKAGRALPARDLDIPLHSMSEDGSGALQPWLEIE